MPGRYAQAARRTLNHPQSRQSAHSFSTGSQSFALTSVPGAKGHGRLVDIDYLVKDASGQQHPTRLQALRFVAPNGTGYEVFVRATTTDFNRYQLGQVLATVRTATGLAVNATRRAIAGRLVQAAAVFWAAELVLLLVYTLLAQCSRQRQHDVDGCCGHGDRVRRRGHRRMVRGAPTRSRRRPSRCAATPDHGRAARGHRTDRGRLPVLGGAVAGAAAARRQRAWLSAWRTGAPAVGRRSSVRQPARNGTQGGCAPARFGQPAAVAAAPIASAATTTRAPIPSRTLGNMPAPPAPIRACSGSAGS